MIQRLIAEHAHRLIFAVQPNPEVPRLRRRTVNKDLLQKESDQWEMWHDEQTAAERELGESVQEQLVLNDRQ
jgi:hypothetical protein